MTSTPSSSPRRARHLAALGLLTLGFAAAGACVFGFRGEVSFADEASLAGLETVQIHALPTRLELAGDPARTFIDWQGEFVSLGGSSADSLRSAEKATMVWETWEGIGRLRSQLPLEIQNITALDHLQIESASYLAHEIVGTGDVLVAGIDAYLSIDLEGGDVEVFGGQEQIRVVTERGDVTVATGAAVEIRSGAGTVIVESETPRELDVETRGPVLIELSDAGNLDLDVASAGQILVDLDGVRHIGAGTYRRSVGPATRRVRVRSGGGQVELRMLADPAPSETGDTGDTGP